MQVTPFESLQEGVVNCAVTWWVGGLVHTMAWKQLVLDRGLERWLSLVCIPTDMTNIWRDPTV